MHIITAALLLIVIATPIAVAKEERLVAAPSNLVEVVFIGATPFRRGVDRSTVTFDPELAKRFVEFLELRNEPAPVQVEHALAQRFDQFLNAPQDVVGYEAPPLDPTLRAQFEKFMSTRKESPRVEPVLRAQFEQFFSATAKGSINARRQREAEALELTRRLNAEHERANTSTADEATGKSLDYGAPRVGLR